MKLVFDSVRFSAGRFNLDLSFTLQGQAVGLFGDSGAGKTSVIELIAGLRRAQGGRITLDDQTLFDSDTRKHVAPEKRGIGYVPQDGALFPHLSVAQNLRYGVRRDPATRSESSPDTRQVDFTESFLAETLDLKALLPRRVTDLSGGERQRVALARALLASPRLLLLDEPLSSLDATHKSAIFPILQRIRDVLRIPLVYVSHQPEELFAFCDHVLVLSHGRLVVQGPPAEVFSVASGPCYRLASRPVS